MLRQSVLRPSCDRAHVRQDVDRELKRACEDLIQQCTVLAAAPIRQFMDKCTAFLSTRPGSGGVSLSAQTFATPEKVKEAHDEFKSSAGAQIDQWKSTLMLYLQDEETVKVLIPPTIVSHWHRVANSADIHKNSIVDVYRQFHDLVRAEYDFSTASGIMTPSAVHNLLLASSSVKSSGETTTPIYVTNGPAA